MAKHCGFLNMQYYVVLKDKLQSFPYQLAVMIQIGTFTFESMLIKYSIMVGVILTYGLAMVKAYGFIPMMCYIYSFHV